MRCFVESSFGLDSGGLLRPTRPRWPRQMKSASAGGDSIERCRAGPRPAQVRAHQHAAKQDPGAFLRLAFLRPWEKPFAPRASLEAFFRLSFFCGFERSWRASSSERMPSCGSSTAARHAQATGARPDGLRCRRARTCRQVTGATWVTRATWPVLHKRVKKFDLVLLTGFVELCRVSVTFCLWTATLLASVYWSLLEFVAGLR